MKYIVFFVIGIMNAADDTNREQYRETLHAERFTTRTEATSFIRAIERRPDVVRIMLDSVPPAP